jgi:hypothetical protein
MLKVSRRGGKKKAKGLEKKGAKEGNLSMWVSGWVSGWVYSPRPVVPASIQLPVVDASSGRKISVRTV